MNGIQMQGGLGTGGSGQADLISSLFSRITYDGSLVRWIARWVWLCCNDPQRTQRPTCFVQPSLLGTTPLGCHFFSALRLLDGGWSGAPSRNLDPFWFCQMPNQSKVEPALFEGTTLWQPGRPLVLLFAMREK